MKFSAERLEAELKVYIETYRELEIIYNKQGYRIPPELEYYIKTAIENINKRR